MKERGKIEKLWSEEKYHVLLHHQHAYDNIRDMLKGDPSLKRSKMKLQMH